MLINIAASRFVYRQPHQSFTKELARIHGKSAHLANCSQLFKKSFIDKKYCTISYNYQLLRASNYNFDNYQDLLHVFNDKSTIRFVTYFSWKYFVKFNILITKEHGSLPNHIARTLTARRICLGRSKSSILI